MQVDNTSSKGQFRDNIELAATNVSAGVATSERTVRVRTQSRLRARRLCQPVGTGDSLRLRGKDATPYPRPLPGVQHGSVDPGEPDPAVVRVVDAAPRLSNQQREQLAAILGGAL